MRQNAAAASIVVNQLNARIRSRSWAEILQRDDWGTDVLLAEHLLVVGIDS